MSEHKMKIKRLDISEEMQRNAVQCATQALDRFTVEEDMATYIKTTFDKKYGPIWHCIVGEHFGCYVSYERNHFIFFDLGPKAFVLFKTG